MRTRIPMNMPDTPINKAMQALYTPCNQLEQGMKTKCERLREIGLTKLADDLEQMAKYACDAMETAIEYLQDDGIPKYKVGEIVQFRGEDVTCEIVKIGDDNQYLIHRYNTPNYWIYGGNLQKIKTTFKEGDFVVHRDSGATYRILQKDEQNRYLCTVSDGYNNKYWFDGDKLLLRKQP